MPQKNINCLLFESRNEKVSFIRELDSLGTGIYFLIKPDLKELPSLIEIQGYDVIVFSIKKDELNLAEYTGFLSKISTPVLFLLEEENYKLAYCLLKSGAGDCLFWNGLNRETLLTSIKSLASRNNTLAEQMTEDRLTIAETIASLFESSKLGFAIFDMSGSMLHYNSAFQSILGFDKVILLQMKLREICYSDYVNEVYYYDDLVNGKISHFELERPLYNHEGNLIWCRILVSLIKDGKNIPQLMSMTISNVSEKRRIQHQLDKERYFLERLMDNIPDAIYFKDSEHRFTKVSRYVHLQGIDDPKDAVGKTDFDFFTKEHAQEAFDDEEKIIKTGRPIINKVEKETFPNGEIAWVSSTKAPLFDAEGNVSGIVGISRDVTEMKLSEEALLKSEERYRKLIEYSPDTIVVICNNKLVFTNSAGLALMKVPDKKLVLNENILRFVPIHYRPVAKRLLEQITILSKPVRASKAKLVTFTGDYIDAEITVIPTTYNDKPAFQVIIRDNTEQKRQEKVKQTTLKILQASNYLKTTEDLFRFIHLAIGNLMSVKNFYIALYDENTQMVSFPYFVDEEDEKQQPKKLGKGLTEYIIRSGKAQLITEKKDIELRDSGEVELIGSPAKIWLGVPLQIKDKTIGALVVQDYYNENAYTENDKEMLEMISFSVSRAIERKKAEEEILNYNKQLKEINATKDRFFSFISHDLRGPFSSLLGFSEMILEDFDSLSSQDVRKYLGIINGTSKNLYNLLNNLLQFSRFQTGHIQFNPFRFNIGELVEKNVDLLNGSAFKKGIELINAVDSVQKVFVDEEMISSAIQNLITNALKFTPRGGSVTISSYENLLSGEVTISVKDTGLGMNNETLSNLFRIEVIHSTCGTEKEPGTGLGLILTKEFVEKNNGTIHVESTPGLGSTFSITLPIVK